MNDINLSNKEWQRKTEAKALMRLDCIDRNINAEYNFRMLGYEMADCCSSGDNAPWDRKLVRRLNKALRMHGLHITSP